ncbi:MAG: saccharopine dehydrogenase NADP-binding domain-containing protein [Patescibacteria group bacterium]
MRPYRHFVVLGGAGTIGKVVVRDLFESHPDNHILVADYNETAARASAESFRDKRVRAAFVDVRKPKMLALELKWSTVVINCLQHDFNLAVMEAALSVGIHYLDLGGLFYWTRKQLQLNKKFQDKGLVAVIGMGCAPGITNILAAYAISLKKKVKSIKIRVGFKDFDRHEGGLFFPYSAQTIIEELTLKPWVFRDGKFCQVTPLTGWELTKFPDPLKKVWTVRTRHSEIATLPISFKDKGLKDCDFKVSFDREFVKEILKHLRSGWTVQQFKGLVAVPVDPNDYEVSRVIVDDLIIDCHAKAKPKWKASAGDVDTACPISIVSQMIATGLISQRGVLPPEVVVPCSPFFLELEKRGLKIKESVL